MRHEYEVHGTCSGEDALRPIVALHGNIDLVLCDIMMPPITGTELQDRIHRDSPELAGRFLIISGGGVTEPTRNPGTLDGYAKRPVGQQQLVAAVRRALRTSSRNRSRSLTKLAPPVFFLR